MYVCTGIYMYYVCIMYVSLSDIIAASGCELNYIRLVISVGVLCHSEYILELYGLLNY